MNARPDDRDPIKFDLKCAVDQDFPRHYSRAFVPGSLLRRGYLLRVLPIYVILVVLVALTQLAYRGPLWSLAFGLPVGVALAVLSFGAQLLWIMHTTRVRITAAVPPGSRYELALRAREFTITDAAGSADQEYRGYTAARPGKHIVVLRRERPGVSTYLPAELFTTEALDWFNQRVRAANSQN